MSALETLSRFFREEIAPRPAVVGGAVALGLGILVGSSLGIGKGFEEPPPMQPVAAKRPMETAPAPIVPMVDADGKSPEWVIGTDNIPGRKRQIEMAAAEAAADEYDEPRTQARWPTLLAPWRWGRGRDEERPRERIGRDREVDTYEYKAPPRARRERYVEDEDEPPPERWSSDRR